MLSLTALSFGTACNYPNNSRYMPGLSGHFAKPGIGEMNLQICNTSALLALSQISGIIVYTLLIIVYTLLIFC